VVGRGVEGSQVSGGNLQEVKPVGLLVCVLFLWAGLLWLIGDPLTQNNVQNRYPDTIAAAINDRYHLTGENKAQCANTHSIIFARPAKVVRISGVRTVVYACRWNGIETVQYAYFNKYGFLRFFGPRFQGE
jgi:hypothetical protein